MNSIDVLDSCEKNNTILTGKFVMVVLFGFLCIGTLCKKKRRKISNIEMKLK